MIKGKNKDEKFNSSNLVPGDIIFIEDEMQIPADCIILSG